MTQPPYPNLPSRIWVLLAFGFNVLYLLPNCQPWPGEHRGVWEKQPLTHPDSRPTIQNIFLGEDIRKQLPNESALFDQVNNNWKSIMDRMSKDSNALRSTHHPGQNPCLSP